MLEKTIADFIRKYNLDYVDQREKGGVLWIVKDESFKECINELEKYSFVFNYTVNGSKSTNYKPAWYLTKDKNSVFDNEAQVRSDNINTSDKDTDPLKIKDMGEINEKGLIVLSNNLSGYWIEKDQLLIPHYLEGQGLSSIDMPGISYLYKKFNIKYFHDINKHILRETYKKSVKTFLLIINELYIKGFRFRGSLHQYEPYKFNSKDQIIKTNVLSNEPLSAYLPKHLINKLGSKGILKIADLNNILVSSLEYICKEDIHLVFELLRSKKLISNGKVSEVEHQENITLSFKNEKITLTQLKSFVLIKDLGIEGCDHLIEKLSKSNIKKLGDLFGSLDDLHSYLPGVGPKTVVKFWDQLLKTDVIMSSAISEMSFETDSKEKILFYENEQLIIPINLLDKELCAADFPGMEGVIHVLIFNGITKFSELPNNIKEISAYKGIGKAKVEKIFKYLTTIINREYTKLDINNLDTKDKLIIETSLFNEWVNNIFNNHKQKKTEKVSAKYLDLMHQRYIANLKQQHLTLELLGSAEGVTREYIRQILKKGDQRIIQRIDNLIEILSEHIVECGGLILNTFAHEKIFSNFLMLNALNKKGIYSYEMRELLIISFMVESEFADFILGLITKFKDYFKFKVFTKSEIEDFCLITSKETNIEVEIIKEAIADSIKWIKADKAILNDLRKKDVVEHVMLQYPEGVEVFKKESELNNRANEILPGSFTSERDFSAIASRNDMSDQIILWGRGLYIHRDFIEVDEKWIHKVQEKARIFLKTEDFIHVKKIYEEYRIEAEGKGVPNEYALYSLIRKYSTEKLTLLKFPLIQLAGDEKQANSDWLIQYLKENGGYASYQQLHEVFVNNRGWKKFTLEQNLYYNNEILQYEHGHYTLLSNYNDINSSDLSFICEIIEEKLINNAFIFIQPIYHDYELILNSKKITSERILYAILKSRNLVNAEFKRYPYVVSDRHHSESINMRDYIENYILEYNDIVQREEVINWIDDIFGQNEVVLDWALLKSSDIFYYTKGRYGEYIHRNVIGINADKEEEIEDVIFKKHNEIKTLNKRAYTLIRELYTPQIFPQLENRIEWSQDLLGDIIKKSKKWNTIGSFDEIIIDCEANINNEKEFLEYILIQHFKGAAKVNDFKKYLKKIRYSKEGQFLSVVDELLDKGEMDFTIVGDEVLKK